MSLRFKDTNDKLRYAMLPYIWSSPEYDIVGLESNMRMAAAFLHIRYGVPLDKLGEIVPRPFTKDIFHAPRSIKEMALKRPETIISGSYVDIDRKVAHVMVADRPFNSREEMNRFLLEVDEDPFLAMRKNTQFDYSILVEKLKYALDNDFLISYEICRMDRVMIDSDEMFEINSRSPERRRRFIVHGQTELLDLFNIRVERVENGLNVRWG